MPEEKIISAEDSAAITSLLEGFGDTTGDTTGDSIFDEINGFHHPNISSIAFEVGMFEVRWYSLAYLAGIILGWLYVNYANKKYGGNHLNKEAMDALPVWIILSVIFGGRIGYVLFYNLEFYLNNIGSIYKIWQGGMSFHGGLTGVIIGTLLYCRYYGLKFFRVTDMLALATPIGLFFGRCANFVNQELVGRETMGWGVIYPKEIFARHPSQLYEAASEGLLLFVILFIGLRFFRMLERTGMASGLFLAGYGICRMVSEQYREPDKQLGFIMDTVSMGQILCIPMIIAGVMIMFFSKRTN